MKVLTVALVAVSLSVPMVPQAERAAFPLVVPNDNRVPAGALHGDTLDLHLVLDSATWRPEGPAGPSVVVPAFAESGGPPQIPAPLIRVPTGTLIRARVRNALPTQVYLTGLLERPAARDSLLIGAGEEHVVEFRAGAPGTYMYGTFPPGYVPDRSDETEQTGGALVVDPPGGATADRVLVINIWGQTLDSTRYRNALAINGLSWPHTERFDAVTGDTIRWRIVNASSRPHPMHLHGFYFTVESRGTSGEDGPLPPEERPYVVTEQMRPYTTMTMSWIPDRPGNWLFHCHLAFHVVPEARLDPPEHGAHGGMAPGEHMAGLVLGIRVKPGPGYIAGARVQPARARLLVQEGTRRGRAARALGYALERDGHAPAGDSFGISGPVLVFERGRPVDMVVVNRIGEPTAVHWHGLELESWSDGVAGWSGADSVLAPAIEPGDSFVARLSVPRAGTFIYHTHMNDIEQLTSGLYGAIVVLERGNVLDTATDHVFVVGWDGAADPRIVVNGDSLPAPLELDAARTHRLRFINISPAGGQLLQLYRDTSLVEWRRVAADGADLTPAGAVVTAARHRIFVGQTADFEVRLLPGRYRLTFTLDPRVPTVEQSIVVRER